MPDHTRRLLQYHEIPAWQQENEYIISSYRPISNAVQVSLGSLSHMNNETINTWSHLLGALGFAVLPLWLSHNHEVTHYNMFFLSIYPLGVAICFTLSTT